MRSVARWARSIATCLALSPALAVPAGAEIYRWTDDEGRQHFPERLEQVPPRHREAAQRRASGDRPNRVQIYSSPTPARRAPPGARPGSRDGEILIPFERRGSLMLVNVRLNDQITAPFYMDTGASGVSLPHHLADRLGLRTDSSTPVVHVHTANGTVARYLVRLDAVQVAGARVEGLMATVNPAMEIGLLGGTFFNNFVYRVDAAEGVIALTPNERIRGGLAADEWRQRFVRLREPLDQLEAYLASKEISRPGRRRELERRREQLRAALVDLEREANRHDVPQQWRR